MDAFRANVDDGFFGTVDSFQGNEADVVIVSLVRNNSRTGTGALGFLSEPQRMNVLLSRAKWRLIIIGSLDFLRACTSTDGSSSRDDNQLKFLSCIIRYLTPDDGMSRPGIEIVPHTRLLGGAH